jgi:hypothetical protein
MILSHGTEEVRENKDKNANQWNSNRPRGPEMEGTMTRRIINETAFCMACDLAGSFSSGLGEEELRQMFEECFETCRQGLEACCLQEKRMQHNLRPKEQDYVRSKAE